ncbi:MAG: hypothetical protein DRI74_07870 [Bacteroidetes bacterium]|nr:MAG: hypothetical protein DRI74_07870 [Bacteroidota bacterium]
MSTVLGKDEKIIREDIFTANLILFWLKANYTLTDKRITGHTPNTLLGLIPLGKAQIAIPLKSIASVISSTKFHFVRLLIGVVLLGVGLSMLGSSFIIGIILAILGLVNILNCYTATFDITNNAGQITGYEISILEKEKVQGFVNEINTIIAEL